MRDVELEIVAAPAFTCPPVGNSLAAGAAPA